MSALSPCRPHKTTARAIISPPRRKKKVGMNIPKKECLETGLKTYPDAGYCCENSIWCIATGVPVPSKMMKRELVVPWSMEPMKNCSMRFS